MLRMRKATVAAGTVLGTLLALPAAGQAATNFGSLRTTNDPTTADCAGFFAPCTIVSYINPIDPSGDPYSGGAPVSGVITKFRIRAYGNGGPATATFRVGNVTPAAGFLSAVATAGPAGPTVTVPTGPVSPTPTTEVAARVPVTAGQHIAVDGSEELVATYSSSSNKFSYVYSPTLVAGQSGRTSNAVTAELLASATIEPDADKDGFGDETQDACPSQATTQGPCDVTPPAVTGLKVSGGKIAYSLSEGSTVSFTLGKGSAGRKVKGKCVKKSHKNRSKPRCTRYTLLGGAFTGAGKAGANTVTLPKPNGKKLRPGSYQLTITFTDVAGNKTVSTKTFTIKKAKKHKKKK